MARPSFFSHPKFFALSARVGSKALAVGTMELLWSAAYSSGNPILGTAEVVELMADWKGEPGALADALVDVGLLDVESDRSDTENASDRSDTGCAPLGYTSRTKSAPLRIHDLTDHAPDYVRKRQAREEKRVRAARAKARRHHGSDRSKSGQRPPNGGQRPENGSTPTPTPTPTPVGEELRSSPIPLELSTEAPSEKKPRRGSPHVAIFEEEARAAGLTPALSRPDAVHLAEIRKQLGDDEVYRGVLHRYFRMNDKFLAGCGWAGRFVGSRLQALLNSASTRTADTPFPPTKPVGRKYADTPIVRI